MSFLTRKIFDPIPHPFGLDLSDLSVKVVHLNPEGKGNRMRSFGSAEIAQGAMVDGEILKPEVVVEAIRKAVRKAGPKKITTRKVNCSLPETKAFLRIVSIPTMKEEEVREAIKWAMEANIPMPIEEVYYDWQILEQQFEKKSKNMNVLVVAVARTVVDQFVSVLEDAGLDIFGLEIESIAQARSLLNQKQKNTTLIIDIGDRRTSFLIAHDFVPSFTSSIPLSGESFTDAIAKAMGISQAEAEKVKIHYGIGSSLKNDHVFTAVRPVVDNLISEIKKSIDFYITGLQYSTTIDEVLLCGGGARTKGLASYIAQGLQHGVVLGDPWVNLSLEKNVVPIGREEAVQFSTAIGLALKEFD